MLAVVLTLATVNPDIALPDAQFDAKYCVREVEQLQEAIQRRDRFAALTAGVADPGDRALAATAYQNADRAVTAALVKLDTRRADKRRGMLAERWSVGSGGSKGISLPRDK